MTSTCPARWSAFESLRPHVTSSSQPDPTIRVYIVDDHAFVRAGLRALIAAEPDMEICGEADDPDVALREIEKLQPDVALIDLSLKGPPGLDLIRQLRAQKHKTRVCVLSVHDESVYAPRVFRAGAAGYLMKHQPPAALLEVIRSIAHGERVVSESVQRQLRKPKEKPRPRPRTLDLTQREFDVALMLGRGITLLEIATRLGVSIHTVELLRTRLKKKLNLHTGPELVRFCVQLAKEQTSDQTPNNQQPAQ